MSSHNAAIKETLLDKCFIITAISVFLKAAIRKTY